MQYKITKTQLRAIKTNLQKKETQIPFLTHRITKRLTCSHFLHLPDTYRLIPLFSTFTLMLPWLINPPLDCFPSSPNPNLRSSSSIRGNAQLLPPFYLIFFPQVWYGDGSSSGTWPLLVFFFVLFFFRYNMHWDLNVLLVCG